VTYVVKSEGTLQHSLKKCTKDQRLVLRLFYALKV